MKALTRKALLTNLVYLLLHDYHNIITLIHSGKVTDEDIAKKLSLISPATNLNQLKDVDLVIEAVYENIDTKKKIFADLDKILNKDTIMATNTSALDIDDIASSTSSPIRYSLLQ